MINDARALCGSRKIRTIKPLDLQCQESYPCQGHCGAVITFDNGETASYKCPSVDLGIIMYYYGIGTAHFTDYVDRDMRKYLDELRTYLEANDKMNQQSSNNNDNVNPNDYWEGPYSVRVHNSVQSVVASDGYNTRHIGGGETEIFMMNAPKMNKEIYQTTYATLGDDGHYYYKTK